MSDETKLKLQRFWEHFTYLIIDEVSMISKSFLAVLSRNIGITKTGCKDANPRENVFGGINVILSLYEPINLASNSLDQQFGRSIYEEFKKVVILKDQVRVTDPVWRDFLQHLRYGNVKEHHVEMLRKLVITNPDCEPTDFSSPPWNDAALVTPRHAVRKQWNASAVRKHCRETGARLYICPAEDTIKGRPLTIQERYGVARRIIASRKDRRSRFRALPDEVEVAIGMKVMVTANVTMDLDITNGAHGEVVDIVLDPREPPAPEGQTTVHLKYPPVYILVKLARTRA
ncbi:hypothetical protein OBBRIDRAFT_711095, partial [Obba rivulosa]